MAAHFTDDATHYYTRLGPHEGAETIGEHTKWAVENIEGHWEIEDAVDDGERVVIEWTMTWRDPRSGERRLDRGTEWFEFRDGRICRGARLPPRQQQEPERRPAGLRPRRPRPHHARAVLMADFATTIRDAYASDGPALDLGRGVHDGQLAPGGGRPGAAPDDEPPRARRRRDRDRQDEDAPDDRRAALGGRRPGVRRPT